MTGKRKSRRVGPPPYCHHKSSGQAYVNLDGKEHYLGKHGTPESLQRYSVLIAEHSSGAVIERGRPVTVATGLTIAELALAYIKHAKTYYVKNGKLTDEVGCIKSAVNDLVILYGDLPANDFGPIALKAVRQKMTEPKQKRIGRTKKTIEVRWTRRYINMSINRIRRMFKWAVSNELVDDRVLTRLQAVESLLAGRTEAREHTPRHSIDLDVIAKIKTKVPARTADLIDLWLLTGARPGELVKLTGEMIDRKRYKHRGVWIAELKDHKTVHRGKQRFIVFNSEAQAILLRYTKADPAERFFPINRATASDAIKRACLELEIPVITAHWLRHTAATRIRDEHGLDAAQAMLGHSGADVTQIYAELNIEKAIDAACNAG